MTFATDASKSSWSEVFAEGRLPKFALILLGVWLTAVDSLVTSTIMPNVGAELRGYAWFGWAAAGFFVGVVLASASAGRLSEIFGLRRATIAAAILFSLGCVMSAAAPDMATFLAGRFLQGIGGGWIAGFAMVAVGLLFPQRHLARVFASVTAVWGIATVLGPLIGGLFAETGNWRGGFWLLAVQALIFVGAAFWLLRGTAAYKTRAGIPWLQLVLLGAAIAAIGLANMAASAWLVSGLVVVGLGMIALVLRLDRAAEMRLLPSGAGDLRSISGSGYAAMFALSAVSIGLLAYGPAILQELHGLSPLWAGYAVATQALAWTACAFVVAGASEEGERRWIRIGGFCILAGLVLLALLMPRAPLGWIVLAAAIMGAGFGFSSSLMNRRVLGVLSQEDKATGSSALIAVRQTGGAVGAAVAGATANLAGFGAGLTVATAQSTAFWVFVTGSPFAIGGVWAAWRMTSGR
jgi:MFS family permease